MRPPPFALNESVARPLTRRNTAGELYERSPDTEAQIAHALRLDCEALLEAARLAPESHARLRDETLCYFIRERLRAHRTAEAHDLVEVLLARHARTIRRFARTLEARHREDYEADITTRLLEQLFDTDSDASDFAQVRFGRFLKILALNTIEPFHRLEAQERQHVTTSPRHTDDEEHDPLDRIADTHALTAEQETDVRLALARLPPELRAIFVLRHYVGWQIEADDAGEPSISRHLGVTPRTVRNRLNRADEILRGWREGTHG